MASARRNNAASKGSSGSAPTKSARRGAITSSNDARATALRFVSNFLAVVLNDGRVIITPLDWYPALKNATPAQRHRWKLVGKGRGFSWPDLDLDLSVHGMVAGMPDVTRRAVKLGARSGAYTRMLGQLRQNGLLRAS